jgi:hypothetical protein
MLLNHDTDASIVSDDDRDEPDSIENLLIPGRPTIAISSDRKKVVGSEGLNIIYRGVDSCPYGKTASRNKKEFAAIVLHHTSPRHDTDWYVQYQIDGDRERKGHFGYHFYISPEGSIFQGAPMTKRTNHVSSKSRVRRNIGKFASNSNSIGITCSMAGLPQGFSPTNMQVSVVYDLVFALCDTYGISFSNVFGHGEIQNNRHKTEGASLAREIRSWSYD